MDMQTARDGDDKALIRQELPEDLGAIRDVNEQAFGQPAEADIVDRLRQSCPDLLSLVAVEGDRIAGHILFSPARIDGGGKAVQGMGLAPIAVFPGRQGRGIGTRLVQAGISMLKGQGCPFIIVLGHQEYYPRFGFERASLHGIRSQWQGVPGEAFMILILDRTAMTGVRGVARYRGEFEAD